MLLNSLAEPPIPAEVEENGFLLEEEAEVELKSVEVENPVVGAEVRPALVVPAEENDDVEAVSLLVLVLLVLVEKLDE